MAPDELRRFLLSEPARTGKLATVRRDGRPHIAPVWYALDEDGTLVFMTGADTVKGRNLAREGRAALCIDDERPPYSFAVIEGPVTLSGDVDEMLPWGVRIAGRYLGADQAEEFGRRNAVPGELLVRLAPDHVTAMAGLAD